MFFSPRPTSPLLVHNSLPSPPPLGPRRVSSRSRLHLPSNLNDPPIPPRLIGSPLLDKLTAPESGALTSNIQKQLWFDGDEFGTRAAATASQVQTPPPFTLSLPSPPSTPRSPRHRRTASMIDCRPPSKSRSRSPPPPSLLMVSIPPVPPIPSSAFNSPGAKRSVLRTPPATPRSRAMQIVIPDLDDPAPETRADRRARRASRTYPVTSPRRRTAGPEAH
ncbi:uncharacterized protein BXZ73DRAFT_105381 [Epithele typhae]|uniref:uncharacterized protein n=1 Tax=Epithele typhae TaxID=378194 RepID=UPI0020077DA1|nr:uncharacterized protein BXZ73DRAFT_105381 [Epithele typhae]KAH9918254.1 hypothetical protein BXZ73DRAFT_105381 [Epithele typhae]